MNQKTVLNIKNKLNLKINNLIKNNHNKDLLDNVYKMDLQNLNYKINEN